MVGLISASCSQFHGGDGGCFPGTGSIYIRSFFGFSTDIPSHGKELVFCRASCLGKLWFSCQLPLFPVYFVSILVLSFIPFFFFLLWWCRHLPAVCLLFSLPALLALLYLIHWIEKKKAWSINVLYDDYNLI